MAFPWPGKKDVHETGSKPEYPSALELGFPDLPGTKAEPVAKVESGPKADPRDRGGAPSAEQSPDQLLALTQRLEHLGQLLDEAKEQVTSYLLHRESQTAGADPARAMAMQLDTLVEKLGQVSGGGHGVDQKLDAIYGKLDQLSRSAPAGSSGGSGEGASSGASEAAVKSALRPLTEKIEQLDVKFKALDALKEAFVPNLVKVRDALSEQHGVIGNGIRQLTDVVPQYFNALPQYFTAIQQQVAATQQHLDAGIRAVVDLLRPPEAEASAGLGVSGDWQVAILGQDLVDNPTLDFQRQKLLSGVLAGEPASCSLVGTLLVFRSAPAEKMPPLLKDIGEAYYRWQPRTTNKPSEMEVALIDWLQRKCEQGGMSNSIELVHPGERFDSTRHNASERGVEITQVLGWVVLRDNGKVYTKASVAVK
jgi:hypothetical protein